MAAGDVGERMDCHALNGGYEHGCHQVVDISACQMMPPVAYEQALETGEAA